MQIVIRYKEQKNLESNLSLEELGFLRNLLKEYKHLYFQDLYSQDFQDSYFQNSYSQDLYSKNPYSQELDLQKSDS
ncbi:1840_t:CDS:2 [Cetraspora pellucida]|uniref:1840_t:CDS:1 n=1 Tax=Cetraspora pellucida TaxID=1433469 RepID=A0ACA9LWN8_9GLOM|nr:1840_t:CDS:2 [Cetraspora pellucida]